MNIVPKKRLQGKWECFYSPHIKSLCHPLILLGHKSPMAHGGPHRRAQARLGPVPSLLFSGAIAQATTQMP